MDYFRLASDCFLVEGKDDAALYDIHAGRLYTLDRELHHLLRRCEDNLPFASDGGARGILESMEALGLGSFHSAPTYIDKFLLRQPVEWMGMCSRRPGYFRVDWSITNSCDLKCGLCGAGSHVLTWQACQSCARRNLDTATSWAPAQPSDFVTELAVLGIRLLHIRGGNPLLRWDYLQRTAEAVRRQSIALLITTPGTGQHTNKILALCAGGPVRLNLVMFGVTNRDVTAATGRRGLLRRQLCLGDTLVAAGLPFFLTFVLRPESRNQRASMAAFARERWDVEPSFAEMLPRSETAAAARLSHVSQTTKPLAPWRSIEEFFSRVQCNTCTFGNFEVSADGKLRACAGLEQIHGDVAAEGLSRALAGGGLDEVWALDKSKIAPCRDCALRYACADCSAFELAGAADPAAKNAYCPHHPARGEPRACDKNWSAGDFVQLLDSSSLAQN